MFVLSLIDTYPWALYTWILNLRYFKTHIKIVAILRLQTSDEAASLGRTCNSQIFSESFQARHQQGWFFKISGFFSFFNVHGSAF